MEKKNFEKKNFYTTEYLRKNFASQFDLVNYAINLAEDIVHSGRRPFSRTEIENPAYEVLDEIASGRDKLLNGNDKEAVEVMTAVVEKEEKKEKEGSRKKR